MDLVDAIKIAISKYSYFCLLALRLFVVLGVWGFTPADVFDFTNVYPYRSHIYKIKTSAGAHPHTPNIAKRRNVKNLKTELVEMAIFIASTKSISRSSGQSAVASASYRAGVELDDKRYGKTHDYSKRSGVMSADIILPTALASALFHKSLREISV